MQVTAVFQPKVDPLGSRNASSIKISPQSKVTTVDEVRKDLDMSVKNHQKMTELTECNNTSYYSNVGKDKEFLLESSHDKLSLPYLNMVVKTCESDSSNRQSNSTELGNEVNKNSVELENVDTDKYSIEADIKNKITNSEELTTNNKLNIETTNINDSHYTSIASPTVDRNMMCHSLTWNEENTSENALPTNAKKLKNISTIENLSEPIDIQMAIDRFGDNLSKNTTSYANCSTKTNETEKSESNENVDKSNQNDNDTSFLYESNQQNFSDKSYESSQCTEKNINQTNKENFQTYIEKSKEIRSNCFDNMKYQPDHNIQKLNSIEQNNSADSSSIYGQLNHAEHNQYEFGNHMQPIDNNIQVG